MNQSPAGGGGGNGWVGTSQVAQTGTYDVPIWQPSSPPFICGLSLAVGHCHVPHHWLARSGTVTRLLHGEGFFTAVACGNPQGEGGGGGGTARVPARSSWPISGLPEIH